MVFIHLTSARFHFFYQYLNGTWINYNLSYKFMSEAIRKENIVEMPDGSDMIAEAMKEVILV